MSTNKIIAQIEAEQMQKELSDFSPGDTVVVQVKVKEGDRERLQAFEGVCIRKRNRALNSAFTVRKISHGVGVERTFQTYSPMVESVSVNGNGVSVTLSGQTEKLAARREGDIPMTETLEGLGTSVLVTTNRNGREILLFPSAWSLDYAERQNPGVSFVAEL